MSIEKRLADDQTKAMKDRDSRRLSCLRMLRSKVQEKAVAVRTKKGKDAKLTDEDVLEVIAAYAKQRRDSIQAFADAGRDEAADAERAELAIIEEYLPKQLGDDELKAIVAAAVAESGASAPKDMGAVMKLVMPKVKGQADGKRVNQLVREALG
jgi:uncharacterized protein YqeY